MEAGWGDGAGHLDLLYPLYLLYRLGRLGEVCRLYHGQPYHEVQRSRRGRVLSARTDQQWASVTVCEDDQDLVKTK